MMTLKELLNTLPQRGEVTWIGLRPERRTQMKGVKRVVVSPETGLQGDHYQGRSGQRHVTLLQAEHLPVIASCIGQSIVIPELLRRNIVVKGINLLALKNKIVTVGSIELEITGLCHPCSRMEEYLGPGGYNAVRGHGGLTARILSVGAITIGDSVRLSAKQLPTPSQ